MRKGTGPRTQEGKARSARNAITHGICSKVIVLKGESQSDFDAMLKGLRKDYRLKGTLAEILVNKLALLFWQVQRVWEAEMAEIQAMTEFVGWEESERIRLEATRLPIPGSGLTLWIANPEALHGCLDLLGELKESIEKDGFDPKYDKGILTKLYGSSEERPDKENWKKTLLDSYLSWLTFSQCSEQERNQNGYASPEECKEHFLEELNQEIRRLERYQQQSSTISARRLQLESLRHSVPNGSRLEQLLRYEAAKSREIERTLKQLERLEQKQLGQAVPPAINVSLTEN